MPSKRGYRRRGPRNWSGAAPGAVLVLRRRTLGGCLAPFPDGRGASRSSVAGAFARLAFRPRELLRRASRIVEHRLQFGRVPFDELGVAGEPGRYALRADVRGGAPCGSGGSALDHGPRSGRGPVPDPSPRLVGRRRRRRDAVARHDLVGFSRPGATAAWNAPQGSPSPVPRPSAPSRSRSAALRRPLAPVRLRKAFLRSPRRGRAELHSKASVERPSGEIEERGELVGMFPERVVVRRAVDAILIEPTEEAAVRRSRS